MTTTLTRPGTREDARVDRSHTTSNDPGDSAHIVHVPEDAGMSPQAYVMEARVNGFEITALCGYTWVPRKMATQLPVCSKCKAIYEHDPHGHGDRGDLPDE